MINKEKLKEIKKLADAMYYAAQYLTTDASRLHKAMEEYHQFIINEYHNEEPVSDDLEEAANKYGKDTFVNECMENGACDNNDLADAFKAGAKWQKEQMMAKAIEGGSFSYKNGFVHISCDIDEHLTDIKIGDKVKLIVFKED